jgi:hypothetical protein
MAGPATVQDHGSSESTFQILDQQLKTALAGEPVVISTQETSSGVSGLVKESSVPYRNPSLPDVTSVFLRGALAGHS